MKNNNGTPEGVIKGSMAVISEPTNTAVGVVESVTDVAIVIMLWGDEPGSKRQLTLSLNDDLIKRTKFYNTLAERQELLTKMESYCRECIDRRRDELKKQEGDLVELQLMLRKTMRLDDRAKENQLNSQHGALVLFYSLAEHGLLKEPYRSWSAGFDPKDKNDPEYIKFNNAMLDVAGSLIMFNDEVAETGKIM